MKILAIRIKNLASLEGNSEIDFTQEPLCSAGIFAITGPTGAGKSTILDALCLALYAKTPRYLQAKESGIEIHDVQGSTISQSDARGILRDGAAEGVAEVDFVGVDRQYYRATWSVRRARNKAEGSLQAFTIALKNINTNSDIPGKKTELLDEIERLVGLNFEQFTRSVLLAQGDFTAFLKAPKDEKSSLLEKLTGTHIYSEISKRIFETHRDETLELRDLNLQREGIPTLTHEELDAFIQQKAAVEIIIESQEKQVDVVSREIDWHARLSVLQPSLLAANTILEQEIETKKNAVARVQKLKQAEQVQPARTFVEGRQQSEKQLDDKASALQKMETSFIDLQKKSEELDTLLQNANNDLIKKIKDQEDAKPLLDEAKVLDVQIRERTEQVAQAKNEVKLANENYKEKEKQLNEKQEEVNELHTNIEELKKWKDENISRQAVADNQSLIISKLSDALAELDTLQSISKKIETANSSFSKVKQEKENLETKSVIIKQDLHTAQQSYDTKSEELSAINLTTLEKDKEDVDREVEDIIKAEAHWILLFNTQKDFNFLAKKIEDNKREVENKVELLQQTTEQLTTTQIQRDASLSMLNKARLASAENVESLRTQLVFGDPCPVCGSTEHPYATDNPQLDNVLAELKSEHHKMETAYTACLRTQSSLHQSSSQLKITIGEQEIEWASKEIVLQKLTATWTNFSIYDDCVAIPDEQKGVWIQQEILKRKARQKTLNDKIQACKKEKQQLDSQQQLIVKLGNQQNENTNGIKDAERSQKSLQEQLGQYSLEHEKSNSQLLETEKMLTPYFSVEDWFNHWKAGPEKFVQHIRDFTEEWKENAQKLEEDSKLHGALAATMKAMQEQLQNLLIDAGKKESILLGLNAQFDELIQKRKTIFRGETALKIEANLKQTVETGQQIVDKHKEEIENKQAYIIRLATQKEQTEKDIASNQKQLADYVEKIKQWLISYNAQNTSSLNESELLQLLTLEPEWIEAERLALRLMDDAITQAQSVLNERKALLEKHELLRFSERQIDELNELLSQAKVALQGAIQNKTEIGFRLQQDTASKQKIGKLLTTIETKALIVENWAKLNDIIGSADGKKFRQIAQEYTLDVLLSYANVHLEMLSKRYLLQRIPNTLALQVLDQDMGNEIRTVFSLSGGESFLVSLALALGLASLSSSRMEVESLFIDEGFGSLDPTTLNIAMDALERLHNQGRKVGVISHVQEMTERIPVQIKVSKQNSGRSRVEVIGS